MSGACTHILVFPYPQPGHFLPLLHFTTNLLSATSKSSTNTLSITLLLTPQSLPLLPKQPTNPSLQTLLLPFNPPPNSPHTSLSLQNSLSQPITQWFHSNPSPPVAIISDFFLGWTHSLAESLGIPRIVFYPSGAFTISIFHSCWLNLPRRPTNDENPIQFDDVPNSPAVPWHQLLWNFRRYRNSGDPVSEFLRESFLGNIKSWGSVFNSFEELEGVYLNHLRHFGKVWAVGPILPPLAAGAEVSLKIDGSFVSPAELFAWLDSKPEKSVVYVCFGSQAVLSDAEFRVLFDGLESSGVEFLWSVKEGSAPVAYLGHRERGVVVEGWVPQVAILNHKAVGGFLTHCGWNSVMEGILAGLPMMTWPMGADQFLTERLIVDELGLAERVNRGRGLPAVEGIARVVMEVMDCEMSGIGGVRERAAEMRRRAVNSVGEGGSSFGDLNMFVEELHMQNALRNKRE